MRNQLFRAVRPHEIALAAEQSIAAFGADPADQARTEQRFRAHLDHGELWGIEVDGALLGHCRLLTTQRYFAGQPVAVLDVVGVAVPEPHRRKGIATALLEGAVAWGAHERLGLSMLFPAVVSLYRRLGWELAGTFPRYRLDRPLVTPHAEAMRTATAGDWPAIQQCAERYAATLNGAGRRRPRRWETLRAAERCYVLDGSAGVDAYVLVYRGAEPTEGLRAAPSVDWAATTPRGVRAVVALLASGALGPSATLHAPTPDFWSPWLDDWVVPESSGLLWMARGLQLPQAVAARGFPPDLDAAVTLAVDDPLVLEAHGPWRLEVSKGRGILEPSRDADVILDVRAFGPLYTGFRSAQQLAVAGLLDGPPEALATLSAMFGGTAPVVVDFF